MSVFAKLRKAEHSANVMYNTGTMLDISTGAFMPGDKCRILNGGVNMITAIGGREQTYKSSVSLTYFGKLMENYPEADGVIYDTEFSIAGKDRVIDLAGIKDREDFEDRTSLVDKSNYDLDGFFEIIREIETEKVKHKNDYLIETPFIGRDGKPIITMRPTFVAIDSWTAMTSAAEEEMFKDGKIDNSTNTSFMVDGNKKSKMMRQLPLISKRAGIIFIITAHVGNKIDMNSYVPSNKDLPMMRSSDKLKGVGSQFKFLVSNLIETRKVSLIQDSKKNCFYDYEGSHAMELQLVESIICRCKNNMSGSIVPHIVSQRHGIQDTLDYYHIMRKAKISPFDKNGVTKLPIVDKSYTRNSIRKLIKNDYEFKRALEIIGQYYYSTICYGKSVLPLTTSEFISVFEKNKDKHEEILNSTGIWSFSKNQDRKYMSIVDIANKLKP
jgi:hypothetical protein